jgi:hypothetical protein
MLFHRKVIGSLPLLLISIFLHAQLPVQDAANSRLKSLSGDSLPPSGKAANVSAILLKKDTLSASVDGDRGAFSRSARSYERFFLIPELSSDHPVFHFYNKGIALTMERRNVARDDRMFYFLLGLLLFYGLVKVSFAKYHDNLFRIFFRSTFRQQQLSEQLLQSPWPSLLLNMLFILSAGLYGALLTRYFGVVTQFGQWQLMLYFSLALTLIYSGKYFILKLFGWTLGMPSLANAYIFTVFMVNKMAGIGLLPFLVLLAFPLFGKAALLFPFSLALLLLLLFYRFMNSFQQVRSEIRLNLFHFFIYLCGFEIAPLLVSFKVLLLFVGRTY